MYRRQFLSLMACAPVTAFAEPRVRSMELNEKIRKWHINLDGSCVQLSIAMAGIHCNDLNASSLPWNTIYGPAERGGATPSRVAAYCKRRGIDVWNVTGRGLTKQYAQYAVDTGRYAAIGFWEQHFQTLYGQEVHTEADGSKRVVWLICNNQTPHKIDRYSDADFDKYHRESGEWIVVLKRPSSPAPEYIDW